MSFGKIVSSGAFIKEKDLEKETLDRYVEDMEKKTIYDMLFTMADMEGKMYWYDKGIRVQMDSDSLNNILKNPKRRADALARMYPVVVKSVDMESLQLLL